MILTIDIGNTTIGFCGMVPAEDGFTKRFSCKLNTAPHLDATSYTARLREMIPAQDIAALTGAALSSVVPELVSPVCQAVYQISGLRPICITAESDTSLRLGVCVPEKLGIDRIVDAAWAAHCVPLPLVTVDMGTATTMTVVDAKGVLRGGAIAPGLQTGLQALSSRCAQLPPIELRPPTSVIGTDTEESMRVGTIMAAAAMIDGLVQRVEAELQQPCSLVLTGGLAHHVEGYCLHHHRYDPDLLHKGLAFLYEKNKK